MFGRFLFRENEMVARGQEGFTRDATNVETSATEFRILLDDRGLESELDGADGGNIAARTGTDDDDVELVHGNEKGLVGGGTYYVIAPLLLVIPIRRRTVG